MEIFCVFAVLLSVASAQQVFHVVPLKETRHLQAIQQPHLPQDQNVVAATQQFLNQFAHLKALADAAPDPPPQQNAKNHHAATQQQPNQQVLNLHGQIVPVFIPQQQQPHQAAAHQQQATQHLIVPVINHHGIVVNPNRYPGPLAHNLPANVG